MSRGIFRCFLRYILLALDLWENKPGQSQRIDVDLVIQAVPVERFAEDMELELSAHFPKHSDLRLKAVRLLMHLQESGSSRQSHLGELLGIEPYALSRLLSKLELQRYVVRERAGTDKIVRLKAAQSA
jgi:hypothetical protein